MEFSLIIPAHNERSRLGKTLAGYARELRPRFRNRFEIIVVANGCTDDTVRVAQDIAAWIPEVKVVDIPEPVGKGGAVVEGLRQAEGAVIVFADADGATDAGSLLRLADQLKWHDVAIGSRRLPESVLVRTQPMLRRLLGSAFAGATRLLFRLPFRDTQCGAKAFRHQAAKDLASLATERRWAFDVDLLLASRALRLDVVEIPVVWEDKDGSRLRLLPTTLEVLSALWRLRRRWAEPGRVLAKANLRRDYSARQEVA